jgi:hypothetical protein
LIYFSEEIGETEFREGKKARRSETTEVSCFDLDLSVADMKIEEPG